MAPFANPEQELKSAHLLGIIIASNYSQTVISTLLNNMKKSLLLAVILTLSSHAYATDQGQTVPSCQATLADTGAQLDFNAYKGKVVLVDFWATWCPPCKKSMPFLNSLRNEKQKDGFEIVAINVDENSDEAKQFLAANPVDYLMAFDPNGNCPGVFDVKAMPSSYLVDKTGTVRLVHLGFRDGDEATIQQHVEKLLAE